MINNHTLKTYVFVIQKGHSKPSHNISWFVSYWALWEDHSYQVVSEILNKGHRPLAICVHTMLQYILDSSKQAQTDDCQL